MVVATLSLVGGWSWSFLGGAIVVVAAMVASRRWIDTVVVTLGCFVLLSGFMPYGVIELPDWLFLCCLAVVLLRLLWYLGIWPGYGNMRGRSLLDGFNVRKPQR